jgi:hypothetical protein
MFRFPAGVWNFPLLHNDQTGSGAHSTSNKTETRASFPRLGIYLQFPIRLHGLVLNYLLTGTAFVLRELATSYECKPTLSYKEIRHYIWYWKNWNENCRQFHSVWVNYILRIPKRLLIPTYPCNHTRTHKHIDKTISYPIGLHYPLPTTSVLLFPCPFPSV